MGIGLVFYTYFWLREDGTPYYIGKGKGDRGFTSVDHSVHCPDDKDRIIVQYYESEQEAFEAEKFFISFYGRIDLGTGCLRNLTDGGEGSIRGAGFNDGNPLSEDHKEKLRQAKLKNPVRYWLGKKRPEAGQNLRSMMSSMTAEERSKKAKIARACVKDYSGIKKATRVRTEGTVWATNGVERKQVKKENIPNGWIEGMGMYQLVPRIWITNGVISKRIPHIEQIPSGWYRGLKTKGTKERKAA